MKEKTKNELIEEHIYQEFLEFKKMLHKYGESYTYELYYSKFGEKNTKLLFQILNATRIRKNRNMEDLIKWVFAITSLKAYEDYNLYFVTLTFSNDVLDSTTKETRRRYVQRYLNSQSQHYMANVDYSKKQREHYHAIAFSITKLDYKKWNWKINIKKIKVSKNDLKRVFTYILKLNNHSFKDSTRQERLIKDKNNKDLLEKLIKLYSEQYHKFRILFKNQTNADFSVL